MGVFEWLETTGLARWVGESLWGYPMMLSLHIVGLAIVVGISWMQDFRILGLVGNVSYAALARLSGLARLGLLVNAGSGLALFSSQATLFVESLPFLTKISAIVAGVVVGLPLQSRLSRDGSGWDLSGRPRGAARVLAVVSIVCWLIAIVAGRLIAYL